MKVIAEQQLSKTPKKRILKKTKTVEALKSMVIESLEDDKAEDITVIDLMHKSSIADYMIIATGRVNKHVAAMAEHLLHKFRNSNLTFDVSCEGLANCDWVLIDAGDIIIHLFRPETRGFYNLEKMWSMALPEISQ